MATTTKILRRRVQNGAALLDRTSPDWYAHVNVASLDMYNGFACVLGQLYGHYCDGETALAIDDDESVEYGFYPGSFNVNAIDAAKQECKRLTILWSNEIQERSIS